jgi:hypothetical protein
MTDRPIDLVTFGEAMVRLTPPSFQRLEQAHSWTSTWAAPS